MSDNNLTPYENGYKAALDGLSESVNPLNDNTKACREWKNGWADRSYELDIKNHRGKGMTTKDKVRSMFNPMRNT